MARQTPDDQHGLTAGQPLVGRATAFLRRGLVQRFTRTGRYRQYFEHAVMNLSIGVCLFDHRDRLLLVNQRFYDIYGRHDRPLRHGQPLRELVELHHAAGNYPGRSADEVWRERKAFIDQRKPGTFLQELSDSRQIAIQHQPLSDGGWLATYEDVTERRQADKHIRFMAQHDALTRLPNRLLFGDALHEALAAATPAQPCALLCLDLDGFKKVNDTHGHGAGDAVLRQVAQRLGDTLRAGDTAARLGGDEFVVLLPRTRLADAQAVAQRIEGLLAEPYDLGAAGQARIGASVGIAVGPEQAHLPDALLSLADKALYAAKRARRRATRRLYEALPPADPAAIGMRTLRAAATVATDLRAALDTGALRLQYQPICHCLTDLPVAFEAVMRWHDEARGIVDSAAFMPAAEESGLIGPVTAWHLRQACTAAANWSGGASVAVVLSPVALRQPDLAATVAAILIETGLGADRLVVEVATSHPACNLPQLQAVAAELRGLGVAVWLDDFGSGHASFADLPAFPGTTVKLGRRFLQDGPQCLPVLRGLVSLAQSCGLRVAAAGVDTPAQHDLLRRLGCDYGQGSLLGQPVDSPCAVLARG